MSALATILVAGAGIAALVAGSGAAPQTAAFWFEPVQYQSSRLGGSLTTADLQVIARVARSELDIAFAPFQVTFSEDREARHAVRVVQVLRNLRTGRFIGVAGEARSVAGFGGHGAVNFSMLASQAVWFAPASASREAIVQAIGRGIGRAAAHEFAHVFLGSALIDDRSDRATYEYVTAARREQYYGELRWGRAWPLLQRRFGRG